MTNHEDLLLAIGRLEGKVDSILSTMGHHHDQIENLDERVRSLEGGRSWLMGGAAAISLFTSFAAKWFSN